MFKFQNILFVQYDDLPNYIHTMDTPTYTYIVLSLILTIILITYFVFFNNNILSFQH